VGRSMAYRFRLFRSVEPARGLPTAIGLWLVYAVAALGMAFFCNDAADTTAFYPSNGVIVAALLVLPRRMSLWFCLACVVLNLACNALGGVELRHSLLYALLNQALCVAVAVLTRTFCGAAADLSRVRRLSRFTVIALVCAAVEAGVGQVGAAMIGDGERPLAFLRAWLQWTGEDSLGLLIGTPVVLLFLKRKRAIYASEATLPERWLLIGLAAAVSAIAFSQSQSFALVLIYPLLMLTAFRAGPAWVAASVLSTGFIATAFTAHGYGPIEPSPAHRPICRSP
jgi:integral membrane sensor domain MASE1